MRSRHGSKFPLLSARSCWSGELRLSETWHFDRMLTGLCLPRSGNSPKALHRTLDWNFCNRHLSKSPLLCNLKLYHGFHCLEANAESPGILQLCKGLRRLSLCKAMAPMDVD